MKTHTKKSVRKTKKQENVSVLSFSAFCIAASLMKSFSGDCTADNFN